MTVCIDSVTHTAAMLFVIAQGAVGFGRLLRKGVESQLQEACRCGVSNRLGDKTSEGEILQW